MNDIEFAFLISEPIGAAYSSAQAYCASLPNHALVHLRSVAKLCCDELGRRADASWVTRNLEDRIEALREHQIIDPAARALLHDLRVKGNMGAHPEDFRAGENQFVQAAMTGMKSARTLLSWMYRSFNPGNETPEFELAAVDDGTMRDVCYRAVIEADPEAEHIIGKMVQDKAVRTWQKSKEVAIANDGGMIGGAKFEKLQKQALYWLKNASDAAFPQAMHDYGKALVAEAAGPDNVCLGEHTVYRAAKLGNADAEAFVGELFLFGSRSFDVNYEEACVYLNRAAETDHPRALANLGIMHMKGLGVPQDTAKAVKLTLRAARSGFPDAQFNAAIAFSIGRGVEQDQKAAIDWLRKASDQGHAKARLTLAAAMREGLIAHSGFGEIESTIRSALADDNSARFELAALYAADGKELQHVLDTASLLQQCYEFALNEGDQLLAEKCRLASPPALKALANAIPSMADAMANDARIITRFFDRNHYPHRSRNEQMGKLAAMARGVMEVRRKSQIYGHVAGAAHLIATVQQARIITPQMPAKRATNKQGRNDLCRCGSGLKSKVCCEK